MTTERRILLCRWGFVLFCLLPTLVVGVWALARAESGINPLIAKGEIEQELARRLGLMVEIDRARGTASAFRLEGLCFRDPETGEIVAHAAAVDAVHADYRWQITAFGPAVMLTHARRLLPRLHDRLLCGPDEASPGIVVI